MSKRKPNPAAVALGRLAAGHRKTMTPAAIEQRTLARAARRCACQVPAADDGDPPRVVSGPAIDVQG